MIRLEHKGGPKWLAKDENNRVLKEFRGPRRRVQPEYEAWLETYMIAKQPDKEEVSESGEEERQEEQVLEAETQEPESEEEPKKENLPDPSKLKGLAKTAALNARVDQTFVEGEWHQKSGVLNESNAVFNIPEGWQIVWATPRSIDGGRHANYLRERGYRPVYRDEMSDDMYEDGMYVSFMDEDSQEFVYKQGAQLFIGPSERLAKLRQAEYDAHMAAFNRKRDSIEADAERQGAEMRTTQDVSTYNPMRR